MYFYKLKPDHIETSFNREGKMDYFRHPDFLFALSARLSNGSLIEYQTWNILSEDLVEVPIKHPAQLRNPRYKLPSGDVVTVNLARSDMYNLVDIHNTTLCLDKCTYITDGLPSHPHPIINLGF